jgi:hypothetical protein
VVQVDPIQTQVAQPPRHAEADAVSFESVWRDVQVHGSYAVFSAFFLQWARSIIDGRTQHFDTGLGKLLGELQSDDFGTPEPKRIEHFENSRAHILRRDIHWIA